MKYDKAVIVEELEKVIERRVQDEKKLFESQMAHFHEQLKHRQTKMERVEKALDTIRGNLPPVGDKARYAKVYQALSAIDPARSSWNQLDELKSLGSSVYEPKLDNSQSSEMKRALRIFKTGAPFEVSVNDLRAFGLLKFVQIG
jgi:hypothetical protein